MATRRSGKDVYLTVVEGEGDPELTEIAACGRLTHQYVAKAEIRSGYRLQNSKDLLRYANYRCPLGDRMRIMSALEQESSATIAECMGAFQRRRDRWYLVDVVMERANAEGGDAGGEEGALNKNLYNGAAFSKRCARG